MEYKTLADLRGKIEADLDLKDELFIVSSEINAYINEAIDDVEAQVHTLYEDYFLTQGNIALIEGQSDYSLPTDIYANKIRRLVYSVGATQYEILRLTDRDGFMEGKLLTIFPTTNFYKYRIINPSASAGVKLRFFPSARETSLTNVEIWYLRNANKLVNDTDKCDIPEFYTYVLQYAKCRCYEKEPGHPNYPAALTERDRLKDLMISTLQSMVPDTENSIEMDMTFYEDMS